MRVLLNGRELPGLDSGLERRLGGGVRSGPIDSVALSPAGSIAERRGQLRLLLGATTGAVVLLVGLNLALVGAKAPQALGYVVAGGGLAVVLVGALVCGHLHADAGRAPPPGRGAGSDAGMLDGRASVRVDGAGLTVGGQILAWAGLKADELGVRERHANERRVTYAERLTLSDGGAASADPCSWSAGAAER